MKNSDVYRSLLAGDGIRTARPIACKQAPTSRRASKRAQIVETVEPGPVAVAEIETQRVIADAFPAEHLHPGKLLRTVAAVAHAEDVALADVRGAGRSGAEFLGRKIALDAVVPDDGGLLANELDVNRDVHAASGTRSYA